MKYKNIILIFIVALFFGCDDYLDVVPENDLTTIESIFMKRNTALQFFSGCYQAYLGEGDIKVDPAICGSDEYVSCQYMRQRDKLVAYKIAEGFQNTTQPVLAKWDSKANLYVAINTCNTFIEHIDEVYNMSELEKEQYKADAKAIKALYYFELLKMYGPIPLVPKNIPIETDLQDMQIERKPVDEVVDTIVSLFDQALPYVLSFNQQAQAQYGLLNKEAVYGYKAKVLVYAASPLFNGNEWYVDFKNKNGEQLFNPNYDPKKWERAAKACDEAIKYCENQGRSLLTKMSSESSDLLNRIRTIQFSVLPVEWQSTELLHGIVKTDYGFLSRLPRYSENERDFNSSILGALNPTMRMVELFYTENGLPIDMDKTWNYIGRYKNDIEKDSKYKNVLKIGEPILNLHLKREPRFYADIAFDKGVWLRNNYYEVMSPYKGGRHGFPFDKISPKDKYNMTGYWCKKGIHPEIYAKRTMVNTVPMGPYPKLRLADIYLLQAEAWNEVSGPNEKVFSAINKIRKRAGIPDVQYSWKKYSKVPTKIDSKTGMREIIRRERMIELAFESQRFWDLRRWMKADRYMNQPVKGWYILGENSDEFYNNHHGPIVVWKKNSFQSPRDYFWPIREEEIMRSDIEQNLEW